MLYNEKCQSGRGVIGADLSDEDWAAVDVLLACGTGPQAGARENLQVWHATHTPFPLCCQHIIITLVCRMLPPRTADAFYDVQIRVSLPCHLSHVCVLMLKQVLQGSAELRLADPKALGVSSIHQQRFATGFVWLQNMLVLALGPVSPANATALRLAHVSWA